MSAHSAIIQVMVRAVMKASKGLVRDFGEVNELQISKKGTANFVTASDMRAEKILHDELKAARPDFGFLLEESGKHEGKDNSMRWIIDPLDGTNNFIHAVPYFCISVALEKCISRYKSDVVAAVIFDPVHNELFTAEKYKGAFLNDKRIRVSARKNLEESLVGTGVPRGGRKEYMRALRMVGAVTAQMTGIRSFGAAALDMAYVAAGRLDGYWHTSLNPWDIAAGGLLIQEAGGRVSDLSGKPDILEDCEVLATNGLLHSKLLSLLSLN